MKTYKIQYQKTMFNGNDNNDFSKNYVYEETIICKDIKIDQNIIDITLENINIINDNKIENSKIYEIGDQYIGPIKKIIFLSKNGYSNIIKFVLGDPFFKLFELKNNNFEEIYGHKCSNNKCGCGRKEIIKIENIFYTDPNEYN